MRNWTRLRVTGGTYFFTVVTACREPFFRDPLHVRCLGEALRHTRASHPVTMNALVVMPDHLHCIWTLPAHDCDYSLRWELVKKRCSAGLRRISPSMGDLRIWQPRFWEHRIRNDKDLRRHLDYIHYNPVKHGHVASPGAWPYSSFGRFVRAGMYNADWGAVAPASTNGMARE
jgi:putative transposase